MKLQTFVASGLLGLSLVGVPLLAFASPGVGGGPTLKSISPESVEVDPTPPVNLVTIEGVCYDPIADELFKCLYAFEAETE